MEHLSSNQRGERRFAFRNVIHNFRWFGCTPPRLSAAHRTFVERELSLYMYILCGDAYVPKSLHRLGLRPDQTPSFVVQPGVRILAGRVRPAIYGHFNWEKLFAAIS
ncbi:hypothetical protein D3C71_1734400 [compost metagenome]